MPPPFIKERRQCGRGTGDRPPLSLLLPNTVLTCVCTLWYLVFGHWMRFEYDEQKNEYNLARHGVDFPTAALIFDDPYAMTIRDVLHDEDEERYNTVGEFSPGSILFVV